MKTDTSIRVSKATLKLIRRYKSGFEYLHGVKITIDDAIIFATLYTDYKMALKSGMTNLNFKEYISQVTDKILTDDEIDEIVERWGKVGAKDFSNIRLRRKSSNKK